MDKITAKFISDNFGWVFARLFKHDYPNGATLEELERDAPNHRWIREVVAALKEES